MAFVKSCPTTQDTYLEASRRLGCVNDTFHHNQYICLPNAEKTSLVEFCNNAIMGIQDKGSCLEASVGKLIRHSCKNFSLGCPENAFWEYEYYKYPACQYINTKQQCYVMDPSCPTDANPEETKDQETIIFACSVIGGLLVVLIITAVILIRKHKRTESPPPHKTEDRRLLRSSSDPAVNVPSQSFFRARYSGNPQVVLFENEDVPVKPKTGKLEKRSSETGVNFATKRSTEEITTLISLKDTEGQHLIKNFITAKIVKAEKPIKYKDKYGEKRTMLKAEIADNTASAKCIVYDPKTFSLFQQNHCVILNGIIKNPDGVLIITQWSQVFAAANNTVDVQSSSQSSNILAVQPHSNNFSSEEDLLEEECDGEICGIPNIMYRYGNYKKYTKNRINLMTCTDSHIKGSDGDVVIELLIRTSNNDMQIFRATKKAIEELLMSLRQPAELSNAEMFLQTIKGYIPLPVIFSRMKHRIFSLKAVRQSTFH